jgi:hypothetical protein
MGHILSSIITTNISYLLVKITLFFPLNALNFGECFRIFFHIVYTHNTYLKKSSMKVTMYFKPLTDAYLIRPKTSEWTCFNGSLSQNLDCFDEPYRIDTQHILWWYALLLQVNLSQSTSWLSSWACVATCLNRACQRPGVSFLFGLADVG